MNAIRLELDNATSFLAQGELDAVSANVPAAQRALEAQTCPGNDFLGWMHLPSSITPEFLAEIKACAATLRENCDTIVVAGIGGSYLGARAVIEALGNQFEWLTNDGTNPVILFAGNNIGEDYLYELCQYLSHRKFGVINISKSGTTTETALAFRLLKKQCEEQRGKDVARKVGMHIVAAKPQCVSEDQVDAALVEKERHIYTEQAIASGKPAEIAAKMVEGRIKKYLAEVTLNGQAFVMNPDQTVAQFLKENGSEVVSFVRYKVGDGIEKKEVDYAAEVAAAAKV